MISTLTSRPVTSELARSWLLVSGRNRDGFDIAHSGDADAIILDIEDAVDSTLKVHAHSGVVQ